MRTVLLAWVVLAAGVAPASAQEQEVVPASESEQRFDELATWLKAYEAWERWFEVWGNRVAHNFDDQPLWQRMPRPQPPVWLEAECQDNWFADGQLASACYILRHWDEHPLRIVQRRDLGLVTVGNRVDDKVVKSSFLQRVHLTGLWMEARYPATPAYGIVGMQIGVFEAGRFTLPAVGVMVVMTPDGNGGHALKPATTVGFGYRLLDFVPPFFRMQATLHFNVATVHLLGGSQLLLPGAVNVNLFGLSVSARRPR
jgi:hypothetical protein